MIYVSEIIHSSQAMRKDLATGSSDFTEIEKRLPSSILTIYLIQVLNKVIVRFTQ